MLKKTQTLENFKKREDNPTTLERNQDYRIRLFIERISKKTQHISLRYMDSWVLVAHTCNPSYSGGRDQEDHGLKPALGK
jgi:hypothetical protein